MDKGTLTAILAVAAVAILGLVMRRMAGPGAANAPTTAPDGRVVVADEHAADPEMDDRPDEPSPPDVPVSSNGIAFIPRAKGVLLVSLVESEEVPDWLDRALETSFVPGTVLNELYFGGAGGGIVRNRLGTDLGAGDLTGARVMRGDTDSAPWRLETLGRDGDYAFHPFTTREAADAVLDLLVAHGVVRQPVTDREEPVLASPEDFEEARRRYEQTASDLAIDADAEPPREGPWVSDRR